MIALLVCALGSRRDLALLSSQTLRKRRPMFHAIS